MQQPARAIINHEEKLQKKNDESFTTNNKSKNIWKMFNTSNNSLSCGFCRCLMEVCVILEALYKKKMQKHHFNRK